MPFILVVDAMHFRTLEEVAHPVRRLHVRVIKKLSCRAAESEYRSTLQIKPKQRVDKQTADDRIGGHFLGVFVERGDHFDTLRAVMDLVKAQPEEVDAMAPAMPPIENERPGEVGQTAAPGP